MPFKQSQYKFAQGMFPFEWFFAVFMLCISHYMLSCVNLSTEKQGLIFCNRADKRLQCIINYKIVMKEKRGGNASK